MIDVVGRAHTMTNPLPAHVRWRLMATFAVLPPLNAFLGSIVLPWLRRLPSGGTLRPSDTPHAAAVFAVVTAIAAVFVIITAALPAVFWLLAIRGIDAASPLEP